MKQSRYQCLIVDDESLGRELIATHLAQLEQFELVATCSSAIEASRYLNEQSIDLLFLDIEMPVLSGTDFYQGLTNKPKVIFTTAYRDYAIDGFELNAVDYLLKPIVFARFFIAIEKFLSSVEPTAKNTNEEKHSADFIFVRSERKNIKIIFQDILYIQSLKDYIKIFSKNKTHMVKDSISAFSEHLPEQFIRVHRSYVVNREQITAMTKQDIELDDVEIPIGEKYRNNIKSILN